MDTNTLIFVKDYLINKDLGGFQATFNNDEVVIVVLDKTQVKPITVALNDLCTEYGLILNNPIKSVNIKTKPGVAPTFDAYGQKVKATYSPEEVRANFESNTSTNLNRRVFILTRNPNVDPVSMQLTTICDVDPSFCLLSLHELKTSEKECLVEEFPRCQECYQLTTGL